MRRYLNSRRLWPPRERSSPADFPKASIYVDLLSGLINISVLISLLQVRNQASFRQNLLTLGALAGFRRHFVLVAEHCAVVRRRALVGTDSSHIETSSAKRRSRLQELAAALGLFREAFIGIGPFSGLINLLMLTAPLFMLQIYDRVLPSHSVPNAYWMCHPRCCSICASGRVGRDPRAPVASHRQTSSVRICRGIPIEPRRRSYCVVRTASPPLGWDVYPPIYRHLLQLKYQIAPIMTIRNAI
jgi:hypothetical protein